MALELVIETVETPSPGVVEVVTARAFPGLAKGFVKQKSLSRRENIAAKKRNICPVLSI